MPQPKHRWKSKPGSFDALNTSLLFDSDNVYGIPTLLHTPLSAVPDVLVPYRTRIRQTDFDFSRAGVHFFLDDYRFETVWSRPQRALEHLSKYRILLTPDFSLYADWPLAVQIWNVYRSRWCGRYWQELGFQVIPTVSWSTPESFDFCFEGIPQNSVVAVSAVGVDFNNKVQYENYLAGLYDLDKRLRPSVILAYGHSLSELDLTTQLLSFPDRWQRVEHHLTLG